MEHVPPPAEELALLDRELARLDARRSQLLVRRAWLLSVLKPPVTHLAAPPAPPFAAPSAPQAHALPPAPFAAPSGSAGAPVGARGAQNVLLGLGGLLLTIAAVAFTLISWGHLGIAGRSAVLGVVTVAALAAPAVLLRRGLPATAESLAALATVLMVLDAYALHQVAMPGTDGLGFAAVSAAVLAVLWGAYGLLLDRLRLPLPLAVVSAQVPLLLWAWAAGADDAAFGWALLATSAFDCAIALRGKGVGVRVTACVGCWVTGVLGLALALALSVSAGGAPDAMTPAALLLAGAAVAVSGARRAPSGQAVAGGVVAGLCTVAAVGGVLRALTSWDWSAPVHLLCGAALLAAVRAPLPPPVRRGLVWASSAVTVGAVLTAAPVIGLSLTGAVPQLGRVWSGTPDGGVRGALGGGGLWTGAAAAPVVLLAVAALSAAAYRWWPRLVRAAGPVLSPGAAWRDAAGAGAVALGWAGLTVLPAVLGMSYAAAVSVQSVLVAAAFATAVRGLRRGTDAVGPAALLCGLIGAASTGVLSLATEAATYAVFTVLLATFGLSAVSLAGTAVPAGPPLPSGRAAGPVPMARIAQAVLACGAVVCGTVLARAVGASLDLATHRAAPVVLVVPAVTVLLGARLRGLPSALPVELTGAAAGVVAVGMAVTDRPYLATVLALCGVLAAGTALRAERRPAAGYLATALFVLAAWLRLSASGVSAPEAYTLPVTVPALVVGWLRRRRDPEASSWTAYGAGLAATLVPSLVAAWNDPHGLRPLLLGVVALVITLSGARLRLQALLLLGGTVLALDALHELAPYVVQAVGALPRWVPLALAGVLLLAVGATYEQRLRDARRLKRVLGRMR
ncbi:MULTISPECIES: SCO7613 C-terminal domain-containing membrane protein [unclassified Streptomyces]|uniref:SCO7613 C-terminal domain-containing membrane protein n=1 Tax=unclassified Streptomyces TaxID=2593676 RepID=UPI0036E300F4